MEGIEENPLSIPRCLLAVREEADLDGATKLIHSPATIGISQEGKR
jgi:hypothetical protein